MQSMRSMTVVTALAVALVTVRAEAQGTGVVTPPPVRSRVLPLEWYAPSLGVATPRGALVRVPGVDSVVLRPEVDSAVVRARMQAAFVLRDSITCPMPVVVRDSAAVSPMPTFVAPRPMSSYGTIVGCVNPLAGGR